MSHFKAFALLKNEAVIGQREALTDDDIYLPMRTNYAPTINTTTVAQEELTTDGAQAPDCPGEVSMDLVLGHYFRPTGDVLVRPIVHPYMKATVFDEYQVFTHALQAGPDAFAFSERITAPSGAEGRVVLQQNLVMHLMSTNGTDFANGDVITGASGNTATLVSAQTANGWAYLSGTASSAAPGYHSTVRVVRDGFMFQTAGALADLVMSYSPRAALDMQWTFKGSLDQWGDTPHPQISQYKSTLAKAPTWVKAGLQIGGYAPIGLKDLTLTFTNNVATNLDAQADTGISSTTYTRDAPTIAFSVNQNRSADFDFIGEMLNSSSHPFRFEFGGEAASGSKMMFLSPGAGITVGVSQGDNNSAQFDLSLGSSAGGDILWFN